MLVMGHDGLWSSHAYHYTMMLVASQLRMVFFPASCVIVGRHRGITDDLMGFFPLSQDGPPDTNS